MLARKANRAEAERWHHELRESKKEIAKSKEKQTTLSTLSLLNLLNSKMVEEGSHLEKVRERLSNRGDNVSSNEFHSMLQESRSEQKITVRKRPKKQPELEEVKFEPSEKLIKMTKELIQKPLAEEVRPEREYCSCRSCDVF